ncbi:MAG: hypothetical protein JO353_06175 [Phycisphaerae bacterium]|nr:hypothetical protein [Phycisphaerae bacterium]
MARPKAGSNLSISQLESMLHTRKRDLTSLSSQHAKLLKQLKAVETKMAALGGKASGRASSGLSAGGRVRNEKSLVEYLDEVLSGATEPMKVGDIVDSVLKAGYHTGSDNFRGIVNQTLIKERRRFGSAGRGLYVSKKK